MTHTEFVRLVARLRKEQRKTSHVRVCYSCHDAVSLREHEAAVDAALTEMEAHEEAQALARLADDGGRA